MAIASETAAGNYDTAGFWVAVILILSFCDRGGDQYHFRTGHEDKKVDLMAISVDIKKNFKGFFLQVKFDSTAAAVGFLGASGSGKSMTLRCIAGIETPDEGKIVINGKNSVRFSKEDQPQTPRRGGSAIFFRIMPCFQP